MDDALARRAAARRASWTGGVARSFDELEVSGVEFWAKASPSAKLTAMLQFLTDAWVIEGKKGVRPPDFKHPLSALADSSAEYLVVGGWAVGVHAEPRFTRDLSFALSAR